MPILPDLYKESLEITCTGYDPYELYDEWVEDFISWCGRDCCEYIPYCEEKSDPVFLKDWTVEHYNED